MRKRAILLVVIAGLAVVTFGRASGSPPGTKTAAKAQPSDQTNSQKTPAPATYRLVAWSELGMHCMDGKDYSVFAVLAALQYRARAAHQDG